MSPISDWGEVMAMAWKVGIANPRPIRSSQWKIMDPPAADDMVLLCKGGTHAGYLHTVAGKRVATTLKQSAPERGQGKPALGK